MKAMMLTMAEDSLDKVRRVTENFTTTDEQVDDAICRAVEDGHTFASIGRNMRPEISRQGVRQRYNKIVERKNVAENE